MTPIPDGKVQIDLMTSDGVASYKGYRPQFVSEGPIDRFVVFPQVIGPLVVVTALRVTSSDGSVQDLPFAGNGSLWHGVTPQADFRLPPKGE